MQNSLEICLRRRIDEIPQCVVGYDAVGKFSYSSDIVQGRSPDWGDAEEYVRALTVIHLVHDLGYRPGAIQIEYNIKARVGRNAKDKRADVAILEDHGQSDAVYALMELKEQSEFSAERQSAWEGQLFNLCPFMQATPRCLVYGTAYPLEDDVAYDLEIINTEKCKDYTEWHALGSPVHARHLSKNYGKPVKQPYIHGEGILKNRANKKEIAAMATELHDILWGGGSNSDTDIFNLIVRLILAKVHDERSVSKDSEYQFQWKQDEHITDVEKRIESLYRNALESRLGVSREEAQSRTLIERGKISEAQLRFAIERLERYAFGEIIQNSADPDLLGGFFERIMRLGFKQDKGQFFTHANIAAFMVDVLDLQGWTARRIEDGNSPPRIIDPSLGSGTFLVTAMAKMTEGVSSLQEDRLSEDAASRFHAIMNSKPQHKWFEEYGYGLENAIDLGLAAQVNMLLHADGSSSIFVGPDRGNGLGHFAQYPSNKSILSDAHDRDDYSHKVNENFDVVITNPPFSVKYDESEWDRYKMAFEMANSKNSEELFLERWFQLLKEGGRLAAVVPDSMLDNRSGASREFLSSRFWVRAIVSLPADAFYPYTSTKTSIIFAQKKQKHELQETPDDLLYLATATYLGYRRTTKSEEEHSRNDLLNIARELSKVSVWF